MEDPAQKVVLLDVRTPDERAVSQIPGAPVLSSEQFAQRREEFRDSAVVCYWYGEDHIELIVGVESRARPYCKRFFAHAIGEVARHQLL